MNYQKILKKADVLRCEGNTKESFKEYKKLLMSRDIKWQIEAYSGMALCLKMDYKLKPAIQYYNEGVVLCKKIGDSSKLVDLYRDIAITYEYFAEYKEAEDFLKKAINIAKKLKKTATNTAKLGITEVKLGVTYLHQNRLEEAEKWLKRGDRRLSEGNESFWKLTSQFHLAELLYFQKKYKKALQKIIPLLNQAMDNDWLHRYAQILILKAACLEKTGKKEEAEHDIQLSYYIANQFDSKEVTNSVKERIKFYLK